MVGDENIMEWNGKSVLVIGTGISGIAATDLLVKVGAKVVLFDGNEETKASDVREKLQDGDQVEIVVGNLSDSIMDKVQIVVLSPGVPIDNPLVETLREKGKQIVGEIELAYTLSQGKIAAITGTNGKTTTTALVGEVLKSYYASVFVVGNIGIPYTSVALETTQESVIAAEISSFQLETVDAFQPEVSAILNLTPDHLNRHYTMENY